jgi:hypothetical protein
MPVRAVATLDAAAGLEIGPAAGVVLDARVAGVGHAADEQRRLAQLSDAATDLDDDAAELK